MRQTKFTKIGLGRKIRKIEKHLNRKSHSTKTLMFKNDKQATDRLEELKEMTL